jgi:hypothetical protein
MLLPPPHPNESRPNLETFPQQNTVRLLVSLRFASDGDERAYSDSTHVRRSEVASIDECPKPARPPFYSEFPRTPLPAVQCSSWLEFVPERFPLSGSNTRILQARL